MGEPAAPLLMVLGGKDDCAPAERVQRAMQEVPGPVDERQAAQMDERSEPIEGAVVRRRIYACAVIADPARAWLSTSRAT